MNRSASHSDLVIVGAGVIGLSVAWLMTKAGRSVTVLDQRTPDSRPAQRASWAGAGILPPAGTRSLVDPYEQLRSLSHQLHPQWAVELEECTGIDNGFRKSGGIHLARSAGEFATLLANESWWDEHGIAFEKLSVEQLAKLVPMLAEDKTTLGAWLLPDECQLRNPAHLRALENACCQAGAQILCGQNVVRIHHLQQEDSKLCTSVETSDGTQYQAEQFCICSGAWARQTLEHMQLQNGIMPIRGQMLLYKFDAQPFGPIINEGHRYLVAREDGHLLAGSVEEEVGYRCHTTDDAIFQIRSWAESVIPRLASMPIKDQWAGLRPGSYDGMPYIGSIPQSVNLFLASGHFRSGLHLSCGTAECLTSLMLGHPSPIDLTPFRIGRG